MLTPSDVVTIGKFLHGHRPLHWGYWHQRADERLGDPPPKRWIQELSVVRDRDGRHPRGVTLWQCTASVCVVGLHCWEILGLADPCLLSVLLIYPRIFLHVFIVYGVLIGFLYAWLYSAICSCVLVVLVKLSVLAKWLAITPSWGEEIISTKPRWKSVFVCILLLFGLFTLLCVPPALHNIYFIRLWRDIAYMCWKCRETPNKQIHHSRVGHGRAFVDCCSGTFLLAHLFKNLVISP